MKFGFSLVLWIFFLAPGLPHSLAWGFPADIDANRLLQRVDDNIWATTKFIHGRLIVDNGRKVRTLEVDNWMEGVERSYSNYTAPAREKGTKMLKVGDKLWMYTPRADRKILIAGHMLRQSMMGSDLSYEDMMEDKKLSHSYDAVLEKMEVRDGVDCAVLLLTSREEGTTYHTRRLWVDPGKGIVILQYLYAKSGKLLKQVEFKDYFLTGTRQFPRKMIFKDLLKENTETTYVFDEVEFDIEIPESYFSQSILKR
ncbi:MAG: outer membrane lipoprotein-sorting protein [Candidatus Nitrohelix vancouverensis]|uniref:Outer membrane lipoprotein-sorting protein n=1 Tax=Candidatus Nitrohelix vancouverensis TaxID=2705534 RepID=A0A7T0G549_9BACT|nr:MAG: outer membrane lipoprotein-sorting protein [Candidatus Nitrohelix vancouverensis]